MSRNTGRASPRGNRDLIGPIPTRAGEPSIGEDGTYDLGAYPRAGGERFSNQRVHTWMISASPRDSASAGGCPALNRFSLHGIGFEGVARQAPDSVLHVPKMPVDGRCGAPRGALEPCGGERPPPSARRSGPVEAEGSLNRGICFGRAPNFNRSTRGTSWRRCVWPSSIIRHGYGTTRHWNRYPGTRPFTTFESVRRHFEDRAFIERELASAPHRSGRCARDGRRNP